MVMCEVCSTREGDHVLLPCGHGGFCCVCAQTLLRKPPPAGNCTICKRSVSQVSKVDMQTAVGSAGKVLESSASQSSAGAYVKRRTVSPDYNPIDDKPCVIQ